MSKSAVRPASDRSASSVRLLWRIVVEDGIYYLDFNATVSGSAFRSLGSYQGFALSIALRRDDLGTDTLVDQIVSDGLSSVFRKFLIVGLRANVNGMTVNFDRVALGSQQNACNPA